MKKEEKNYLTDLHQKEALKDALSHIKRITHYIVFSNKGEMRSCLYNGEYDKKDIENAILVQSKLGELCKYLNEIIVENKKFDQRKLLESIGDSFIIYSMKNKIEKLKKENAELRKHSTEKDNGRN